MGLDGSDKVLSSSRPMICNPERQRGLCVRGGRDSDAAFKPLEASLPSYESRSGPFILNRPWEYLYREETNK